MLDAGATGCVLKSEATKNIIDSIKSTARGECWLSPSMAGKVLDRNWQTLPNIWSLSAREKEVLSRLAEGGSNNQIAQVLEISAATVKNHLSTIYSKLGVKSRSEAIVWAWKHGLVTRGT